MVTPVVVELSKTRREQRQEAKALRAAQDAGYVSYRRRSATGAFRIASAVVVREAADNAACQPQATRPQT